MGHSIGDELGDAWNWTKDNVGGALKDIGLNGNTPGDDQKIANLNGVGAGAMGFAGQAQGNYGQLTQQGMGALNGLQDIANGGRSVSAEQLRQGLQQNLASQQAAAASAGPGNAAMAARNGMMNMSRMGTGLAGQQAVAGLAERNQAQGQYGQLLGQMRGQDLQGTLGGYGAAAVHPSSSR